jgi:phosphoserine phosphatase
VFEEVSRITHEAMSGGLEFDESLRRRCAKLEGLPITAVEAVYDRLELSPGAEELILVLRKLGYKTALISGGFTFIAERLQKRLKMDSAYANQLEVRDGRLTGRVIPPIVNARRKAELVELLARDERISLEQVIAIGDG